MALSDVDVVTAATRLVNAAATGDDSASPSHSGGMELWAVLLLGFGLTIIVAALAMTVVVLFWICCPGRLGCRPPLCLRRRGAPRTETSSAVTLAELQRSVEHPHGSSFFEAPYTATASEAEGGPDSETEVEVLKSSSESPTKQRKIDATGKADTAAVKPTEDTRNPLEKGTAAVRPAAPPNTSPSPEASPRLAASPLPSISIARSGTPSRAELVLATLEDFDSPARRLQRHQSIASHIEGGLSREESIRLHLLRHSDTTESEFGTFIEDVVNT